MTGVDGVADVAGDLGAVDTLGGVSIILPALTLPEPLQTDVSSLQQDKLRN